MALMPEKKKKIFIVDGYGQIYRYYFAFMTNPIKDREGRNISAVFGFFNTVMSLIRQYEPDYLAVAMDSRGKTFRHEMYGQYKANRDKTPEDLHAQVPIIDSFLDEIRIPHLECPGMEADDLIAAISKKASAQGIETVMVTGDKDLLQLVKDDVLALRPPRKGEKEYRLCGKPEVEEIFGVKPEQMVDYLTILGDASDNVPGIDGIGEKGAVKLLSEYQSLEEVYKNINSFPKGTAAKLEAARDHIKLTHDLVLLKDDVLDGVKTNFEDFSAIEIEWKAGARLFRQMGSEHLAKVAERLVPASDFSLEPEGGDVVLSETEEKTIGSAELEKVFAVFKDGQNVALAAELSEEDDMRAEVLSFSLTGDGTRCYKVIPTKDILAVLRENIGRFRLIGQNLKTAAKVLMRLDIDKMNLYGDTVLARWLLNTALTKFEKESCVQSFREFPSLEKALEQKGLLDVFHEIEMPLTAVLAKMEYQGIILDSSRLVLFGKDLENEVFSIQQDIYTLCGKEFNLNSPKQLQEVLFVDRNLPTGKKTKSGFSTDSNVLEDLAYNTEDPVPAMLLRYRTISKLLSTYVNALPELINPKTGRVHTSFLQTGTATGRLSSKNPNLQNIPIRTDEGRRIRDAFVPKEGCVLLSADYSQIELVVLSHVSGDSNLRNAFLHGDDVHKSTAALIFNEFPEMVTPEQRRVAKTINFGIMYGMSAFRLSNDLKIGRREAQKFIDTYFQQYSGVRSFVESVKKQAKEDGFVKTAMGHIRYIPEMKSSNKAELAAAERAAVNTVIQGTAAEIMKKAMISLDREMSKTALKSKILLQVHDELIIEVPENEIEQMKNLVRTCMENAYRLSVPLKVGIETGKSWGEMH